jgi:hypothetical protein
MTERRSRVARLNPRVCDQGKKKGRLRRAGPSWNGSDYLPNSYTIATETVALFWTLLLK